VIQAIQETVVISKSVPWIAIPMETVLKGFVDAILNGQEITVKYSNAKRVAITEDNV
jgi:hypothetical protein